MHSRAVQDLESWREVARGFLQAGIPPELCDWQDADTAQRSLLGVEPASTPVSAPAAAQFSIPAAFLPLAQKVACHRDGVKWQLLYRLLWRLTHGERHLLNVASDPDVLRLRTMAHQVSRDAHKAKAFMRFRSVTREVEAEGERENFVAWHCPDHKILPLVAPFFMRRFGIMDWAILTPDQSVSWDGQRLTFGPGVPKSQAPSEDAMEEVWRTFYRAIFNPARIKIKMMKQEMPVRYWQTMPETSIIPDMLREAGARVGDMLAHQEGLSRSAEQFLPETRDIAALAAAARNCAGCPLHCHAKNTVFGAGHAGARLMIVGEQPGEQEDDAGIPFIGPAGDVLARAMAAAGAVRDDVYLTNAVKHFKFEQRGEKRIHQSPNAREINACKPWLAAEIEAVKPAVILGLGLTAAKALVGHGFSMKEKRGQWLEVEGRRILITYHPAAVLRAGSPEMAQEIYAYLQRDLATALAAIQ